MGESGQSQRRAAGRAYKFARQFLLGLGLGLVAPPPGLCVAALLISRHAARQGPATDNKSPEENLSECLPMPLSIASRAGLGWGCGNADSHAEGGESAGGVAVEAFSSLFVNYFLSFSLFFGRSVDKNLI